MHHSYEREWIRKSGLFDDMWYLQRNPDVAASGVDPLYHWCEFGHKERRDPSAIFSVSKYRQAHPDCFIDHNPLFHAARASAHRGIADHRLRVQSLHGRPLPALSPGGARVIASEIIDANLVRKIAVIKLDHIGDVYLSLSALDRLRQKFPKADFTIFCASFTREVFQDAGFAHCVTLDVFSYGGVGHGGVHAEVTLPDSRFDLAIDFRVERDAREIVFSVGSLLTAAYDPIADYRLPYVGADIPHERQLHLLVERISSTECENAPALPVGPLRVVLCPSGSVPSKQWPRQSWIDLARLLMQCGHMPIFLGAPNDREDIERLARETGAAMQSPLPLTQYAAWVIDSSDVYVGNDTGTTHAVALRGHRVVEIIGGYTNVEEWVAHGPNVLGLHRPTHCSPCFSPRCCPNGWYCLLMSSSDVLWAIEQICEDQPKEKS